MAWFFTQRASRSATLRAQLHLAHGERILARVAGADGGCVVGTERALYWCPPGAGWSRLGWEEISRVDQDRATGAVVVSGLPGGVPRRVTLPVTGAQGLRAFAQERVTATCIAVTRIVVDGRRLWVEVRRQPATDLVHFLVRLDDDLDPADTALRATINRAVAELRATLDV
jgi:hypothetical protein